MKQLSSFMVLNIDGGDRVSSQNKKENFWVVDKELKKHIDAIRSYVRENKLN